MSFAPAVPRRPTAKISRKRAQAKRIQGTGGSRPHRDRRPKARSCFVFLHRGKQKLPSPSARTKRTKGTERRTPRSVPFDANHPCIPSGPVPIRAPPFFRHPDMRSVQFAEDRHRPFRLPPARTCFDRPPTGDDLRPSPSRRMGKGWRFSADASVGPVFVAPGRYMQGQQPDGRRL